MKGTVAHGVAATALAAATLALAAALAGCGFDPQFPSGKIACEKSADCPPSQICVPTGNGSLCYALGDVGDAGGIGDAGAEHTDAAGDRGDVHGSGSGGTGAGGSVGSGTGGSTTSGTGGSSTSGSGGSTTGSGGSVTSGTGGVVIAGTGGSITGTGGGVVVPGTGGSITGTGGGVVVPGTGGGIGTGGIGTGGVGTGGVIGTGGTVGTGGAGTGGAGTGGSCTSAPACSGATNGTHCGDGTTLVACSASGLCQQAASSSCTVAAAEKCVGAYPSALCEVAFGFPTNQGNAANIATNLIYGVPITVASPITVSRLGVVTTAASNHARMAIYSAATPPGPPLMWMASAIPSQTLTAGRNEFAINDPASSTSVLLPKGTYWIFATFESATSVVQTGAAMATRYGSWSPWNTPFPGPSSTPVVPTGLTTDSLPPVSFYVVGVPSP